MYRPLYFAYKTINDREKISRIRTTVKNGMTVLDVGANVGFYTILLSKLVGEGGRVYSFEPDNANFSHLKRNTVKLSNVILVNAACGDRDGKAELFVSDCLNVDHQCYDSGENRKTIAINMLKLDNYLPKDIKIGFAKIDVQGYELNVIRGMRNIIEKTTDIVILGEFWPSALKNAGVSDEELLHELRSLSFATELENKDASKGSDKYWHTDFWARKRSECGF